MSQLSERKAELQIILSLLSYADNESALARETQFEAGFTALGFSGQISGDDTISVSLDSGLTARYIKLTFANNGTAIDEVVVFGVPSPDTGLLFLLGGVALILLRKNLARKASV
ncbi:MAG: hypothetical protein ACJAYE_001812 [Candidatus Azotimanducaceae bacterium]